MKILTQTRELQTQVRDLRRSYSPDPSSFLRSSESSHPSQRRDYIRSLSNNVSMRYNDDDDERDLNSDPRVLSSYPVSGVKSRRPSIEKKVRGKVILVLIYVKGESRCEFS